ncbi:MAG: CoA-binding protein [Desulfobacteraceae bacterium]|jgi:acyl-CoA synthetase (NDP forming)
MDKAEAREFSSRTDLSCFFEPRSIAVIGSFREDFFGGYVIVKSLLNAGYKGQIYPVNPAYQEVHGLMVYPSVKDVPQKIDLAFIMINARSVLQVMEECAEKGARAIVVISDGFAERDQEGVRLQEELVEMALARGIRIIGPNTAGVANTANGLNPCPYEAGYYNIRRGPVAICAQTGMVNPQAFPYPNLRFGVSKICDFGNKSDVDECDMLEYLEKDPDTRVITLYLESIRDGQRFVEISKRVGHEKPVLVLKSGRTREGAKASVSHTGAIAVDDKVFESACIQAGVLRLDKFDELFELPKVFVSQRLPAGNRLGIMSFTGGVAVLVIDEGAKYDLAVTTLSPETTEMLNRIFPGLGSVPVDMGPVMAAVKDAFARYPEILSAVMADRNVDALFNVLWANPTGSIVKRYIEAYEMVRDRTPKPLVTWIYGPSTRTKADLAERIEEMGFPVFEHLESAVKALGLAYKYAQIRQRA